jgi:hypothetical protein
MASLWSFIAQPKNRQILSWIGGGIVAVAVGAWAVVTHVWPAHGPAHEPASTICAQQGIAIGGNVSGSTVTNTGSGSSSAAPCVETKKGQ